MTDVGKIADEFEKKILETHSDKFVLTSGLSRIDAERLAYNYLKKYDARIEAINPHIPDLSTYIVAAQGRNQNA